MPRTADHTTRAHAAFIRHKKSCTDCSPVPTIGPCPTGLELRDARDAAALDFLEDTVRSIPTVAFTCRNPRGETIVHFTAPGRVVGGVSYRPHEGSPWVVSVGVKVGPPGGEFTHRHGSARPEANDIASAVTEVVGEVQGPSLPQGVSATERVVDVALPGMHDLTA
ncbi:hypothetical protein ABZ799_01145 [Nocardiopsis dassonvillei]|uniref:hypothetical protein n=1 Tax=Nocardiopsis dassonvillei TaxID=2014 RepID=UPI0033CCC107